MFSVCEHAINASAAQLCASLCSHCSSVADDTACRLGRSLQLPSCVACRYATSEQSKAAAESMHGMPVSRAMHAADAAQAPTLAFTQQSCLTFAIQEPAPLLHLRPAAPGTDLTGPDLSAETAKRLFPDWEQAQRPLRVPETVLAGELVPVPLVVTRTHREAASALRLSSSDAHCAVLPDVSIGAAETFSVLSVLLFHGCNIGQCAMVVCVNVAHVLGIQRLH